jgi:hypothetical protein
MPASFPFAPTFGLGNSNHKLVSISAPVSIESSSLEVNSHREEEDEGVDSWEEGSPNTASFQAGISTSNKASKSEFADCSPAVDDEKSNWLVKLSGSPKEVSKEKIASNGSGAGAEKVLSWAAVSSPISGQDNR